MEKKFLMEEQVTLENVEKLLNDMFYEIRELWYHANVNEEGQKLLADCVELVQIKMGEMNGNSYALVENLETHKKEYVKKEPKSPATIYNEALWLVDYVNQILEKYKKTKKL